MYFSKCILLSDASHRKIFDNKIVEEETSAMRITDKVLSNVIKWIGNEI